MSKEIREIANELASVMSADAIAMELARLIKLLDFDNPIVVKTVRGDTYETDQIYDIESIGVLKQRYKELDTQDYPEDYRARQTRITAAIPININLLPR